MITSKAQTTIPQPVRAALGIRQGDELGYVIEDGRVFLIKSPRSTHATRCALARSLRAIGRRCAA